MSIKKKITVSNHRQIMEESSSSQKDLELSGFGPQNTKGLPQISLGSKPCQHVRSNSGRASFLESQTIRKNIKVQHVDRLSRLSRGSRQRRMYTNRKFSGLTLAMLLVVLFLIKLDLVVEAANDDIYDDDYYQDDYYDDVNFNYSNYDDADYGRYSSVDDAENLVNDDYYIKQDDYIDPIEQGIIGFGDISFMPISCIQ